MIGLFKSKTGGSILFLFLSLIIVSGEANAFFAKESYNCDAEENREIRTTLKLKLERKWKKKKKEIKKKLVSQDKAIKVRLEFFAPRMTPPMNLGIGKCVSADNGRRAIKEAIEYNRGVEFVIMQEFMPHHWTMIGTTNLAELTFIKITPEQLQELSDPSLSTEQFQKLYRKLSALRERKLPFGLGTRKIEVEEEP